MKISRKESEWCALVAHEIRTPLTALRAYSKFLLSQDAGPLNAVQKESIGIVDTNLIRLNRLLDDLLDTESLSAGRLKIQRQPEDLVPVLRECIDTFQMAALDKRLKILVSLPQSLGPVLADRARLIQIFMNLISNAIKYTPAGNLEISAKQTRTKVKVLVKDSGIGLSSVDTQKLFKKYFRAGVGSKEKSGSGLGLAIARRWVEAFGGKISVKSEPSKGTEFAVSFPRLLELARKSDLRGSKKRD